MNITINIIFIYISDEVPSWAWPMAYYMPEDAIGI